MPLSNEQRNKAKENTHRERVLHFAHMAKNDPSLLTNKRHAEDQKNALDLLGRHLKNSTREDIQAKAIDAASKREAILESHVTACNNLMASILAEYKITSVDQLDSSQNQAALARLKKVGVDQQKELSDLDALELAHYETELLFSLQKG